MTNHKSKAEAYIRSGYDSQGRMYTEGGVRAEGNNQTELAGSVELGKGLASGMGKAHGLEKAAGKLSRRIGSGNTNLLEDS
jgi:hypothetical protein